MCGTLSHKCTYARWLEEPDHTASNILQCHRCPAPILNTTSIPGSSATSPPVNPQYQCNSHIQPHPTPSCQTINIIKIKKLIDDRGYRSFDTDISTSIQEKSNNILKTVPASQIQSCVSKLTHAYSIRHII